MLIDHVIKPFGVLLLIGNLLAQRWKILSFATYAVSLTRIAVFKFSNPNGMVDTPELLRVPESS
jgi:hypothetical protein